MDRAVDRDADGDDRDHRGAGVQRNVEQRHDAKHQRDRHHAGQQRDQPALERGEHHRHHQEDHREQKRDRLHLAPEQAIGGGIDHQVFPRHGDGHVGPGDVPHHLAQLLDMVVQRRRVLDVVPHHDVGAPEILADVGLDVAPLEKQQALRHQLARRRHERKLVGERKAAVEDALLGDEGLDFHELLQVRRVLECALAVRFQRDVEDLYSGQIVLNALRILHQGSIRAEVGQRIVGHV